LAELAFDCPLASPLADAPAAAKLKAIVAAKRTRANLCMVNLSSVSMNRAPLGMAEQARRAFGMQGPAPEGYEEVHKRTEIDAGTQVEIGQSYFAPGMIATAQ
jgi:hypothetical protein